MTLLVCGPDEFGFSLSEAWHDVMLYSTALGIARVVRLQVLILLTIYQRLAQFEILPAV